jgi:hypothetical protein
MKANSDGLTIVSQNIHTTSTIIPILCWISGRIRNKGDDFQDWTEENEIETAGATGNNNDSNNNSSSSSRDYYNENGDGHIS